MLTTDRSRVLFVAGLTLIPLGVILTVCGMGADVALPDTRAGYADAAALRSDASVDAPWVPADATRIELRRSSVGEDATILLASDAMLDPALCVTGTRTSVPAYTIAGAPDVYRLVDVLHCGAWDVARSVDGWLGWTSGDASRSQARTT